MLHRLQAGLIYSRYAPEESDQLFMADACLDCSVHLVWMGWLLNILNITLSGEQQKLIQINLSKGKFIGRSRDLTEFFGG